MTRSHSLDTLPNATGNVLVRLCLLQVPASIAVMSLTGCVFHPLQGSRAAHFLSMISPRGTRRTGQGVLRLRSSWQCCNNMLGGGSRLRKYCAYCCPDLLAHAEPFTLSKSDDDPMYVFLRKTKNHTRKIKHALFSDESPGKEFVLKNVENAASDQRPT
jgi:hypothetical protein